MIVIIVVNIVVIKTGGKSSDKRLGLFVERINFIPQLMLIYQQMFKTTF